MEQTALQGEMRTATGTGAARALRASGKLPAVIYGHGEKPESITLEQHEVEVALAHGARTLEVQLGKKKKPYLIKEVQYDHLATTPIHLDLARVDLTELVRVRVGIELRGTPKGIADGGMLDQMMADLEVECTVTAIPDTLHPLVTGLELGDSLLVRDLELPEGVTAMAGPDDRVAVVKVLAIHEEEPETPVEESEESSAEPERIGRVRKDDEGAEKAS